jgi:hypothetical protein
MASGHDQLSFLKGIITERVPRVTSTVGLQMDMTVAVSPTIRCYMYYHCRIMLTFTPPLPTLQDYQVRELKHPTCQRRSSWAMALTSMPLLIG